MAADEWDALNWSEKDGVWYAGSVTGGVYKVFKSPYDFIRSTFGLEKTKSELWECDYTSSRSGKLIGHVGESYDLAEIKKAAAAHHTKRRLLGFVDIMSRPVWHPASELPAFLQRKSGALDEWRSDHGEGGE